MKATTVDWKDRRWLAQRFAQVVQWARAKNSKAPFLTALIDCPRTLAQRRKGDKRAFMHVGHVPRRVCMAAEVCNLNPYYQVGLMLHELGHPMAEKAWGRSEQEDADQAVKEFLGVEILYKGPLVLQAISHRDFRRICGVV